MTEVRFKDVLSYVGGYWRNYPALVAGLVASMLAATLCDVFMPVLAGRLIDSLSAESGQLDGALWALGAFVGLGLAFRVFREGAMYLWIMMATRVMGRIVTDAFYRVQRFSTDWHANSFAGATVRKISRGMWAYDLFADTVYVGFFPAAVVLTGVTTIIFLRWPLMGLAVVAAILVYVGVSVVLATRYVAPANLRMNAADTAVGGGLADAITCNPTVKAFGAEGREDRRFFAVARSWQLGAQASWFRQTNTSVVQGGLAILIQVTLLGMAVWFWAQGRASAGDVTFVLTSFFLINGYLREVGNHVRNMQRAINEMQDIILFSRMAPGVEDAPGARGLHTAGGEIRFENVRFRYDRQSSAIYDDFRLRIAPGERVALVGHSGSGKSTFVKLVQRLYDLESGRILIDGQDIALATQESVRQAIAVVPQEPILFHRSLAENIGYGDPDAGEAAILRAARQAHADRFIAGLDQGYDTLVGERGVKLSGGERQRVAIARAFLADSPILILDEATSSLDSVTEALIQDALERLMEGRTTIVIAHRLSTIQRVDRILVFRDGRVVEQGTHGELLAIPNGHYRELYEVQTQSWAS